MASSVLWKTPTSRGTVLTTELNSKADGDVSALGTALDNATNKDQYGFFELVVTYGTAPAAGKYVNVYEVISLDGTNYGDSNSGAAADTAQMKFVCAIPVKQTTSAQRLHAGPFLMRPFKTKYALENKAGVATASSGNTLSVYSTDDEGQ